MLEISNVIGVIAVIDDIDGRRNVPPILWFVSSSSFVSLEMTRTDARKYIVRRDQFDIEFILRFLGWPGREPDQRRITVDRNELLIAVSGGSGADSVNQWLTSAYPTIGQRRKKART